MKSPFTTLTAAAVVILACVIGLSLWKTTGSEIALADVLALVEEVKAVRWKATITTDIQRIQSQSNRSEARHSHVLMSREYGFKSTEEAPDPNGGWMLVNKIYILPRKKTLVQISPRTKTYYRTDLPDENAQGLQKLLGQWGDPGAFLKEIMACKYENIGRSVINGVDVVGFRSTDSGYKSLGGLMFKNPQIDVKIWVDAKTRLPVRYEDICSGLDQNGNRINMCYVYEDYEWDVPVTAADFEPPPIPDGYTVGDFGPPRNEETAIQGLRKCIELFGKYIDTIGDTWGAMDAIFLAFEKSETPAALKLKEEIKGLAQDEKSERLGSAGLPIRRFFWFYGDLDFKKKDPVYYGKTVTPKDADKVLMRWKVSDNEYRVIFGDLHAETVSPERLAELEQTVPK